MAGILRGDVMWADLNPGRGHKQAGMRPVVVVSHDIFNQRSGTVIAMAVTSQADTSRLGSCPVALTGAIA